MGTKSLFGGGGFARGTAFRPVGPSIGCGTCQKKGGQSSGQLPSPALAWAPSEEEEGDPVTRLDQGLAYRQAQPGFLGAVPVRSL